MEVKNHKKDSNVQKKVKNQTQKMFIEVMIKMWTNFLSKNLGENSKV